jgi:hypothetical protein
MLKQQYKWREHFENYCNDYNYALFLPSISSIYVRLVSKLDEEIRNGAFTAKHGTIQQLNFFDELNALFYYPFALYSFGHALRDIGAIDDLATYDIETISQLFSGLKEVDETLKVEKNKKKIEAAKKLKEQIEEELAKLGSIDELKKVLLQNIYRQRERFVQSYVGEDNTVMSRSNKTMILGDSGGFQVAKGVIEWPWDDLAKQDEMRQLSLNWLEETSDWAMTLDFPYKALDNQRAVDAGMDTPEKCLQGTIKNLEYFMAYRSMPKKTKFLNVLQGRNIAEADQWFNAVKDFNNLDIYGERAFEGWAFGGVHAFDFELIMRRVLILKEEGLLEKSEWLHFLGSGKVHGACAFTELQRQINAWYPNKKIRVSYDAASPFVSAAHGRIYSNFVISRKGTSIPMERAIDNKESVGSTNMFMHRNSPIGVTLDDGDICFNGENGFASAWDGFSYVLLMAHSLYLHIKAIETVNAHYSLPDVSMQDKKRENGVLIERPGNRNGGDFDLKKEHLPREILKMGEIIKDICSKPFDQALASFIPVGFDIDAKIRNRFLKTFMMSPRPYDVVKREIELEEAMKLRNKSSSKTKVILEDNGIFGKLPQSTKDKLKAEEEDALQDADLFSNKYLGDIVDADDDSDEDYQLAKDL